MQLPGREKRFQTDISLIRQAAVLVEKLASLARASSPRSQPCHFPPIVTPIAKHHKPRPVSQHSSCSTPGPRSESITDAVVTHGVHAVPTRPRNPPRCRRESVVQITGQCLVRQHIGDLLQRADLDQAADTPALICSRTNALFDGEVHGGAAVDGILYSDVASI